MTVSSTTNRVAYTGNGVTTSFSFPYYFVNKSDLAVYVAGVLKTLNTDYTIAGTAPFPSGQNVVFSAAPANGASVVIVRVVPYTQTLDLVENDPLPAEDLEKRLDLTTMMVQQLAEQFARTLTLSITSLQSNITLADLVADKALVVNGAGTGIIMGPSTTEISNAQTYATNAASSASAAATSASSASTSASNASASASAASTSASSASTSASNASTSATNASNSASAASTSATNAATSETNSANSSKLTLNAQSGTTYTLVIGDANKEVECTNASAITVTVPPNSSVAFPLGTQLVISQGGAGQVTIAAGAGVTLKSKRSWLKIETQEGAVFLRKLATDTWRLTGDLVP